MSKAGAKWATSEAAFQAAIVELAHLAGWATFHVYDSRRSAAGWPDLILCQPPRLLAVELKSAHGRLRREQRAWLDRLAACGIQVRVWRPSDWPAIERELLQAECDVHARVRSC
jgi:hypothetical protein